LRRAVRGRATVLIAVGLGLGLTPTSARVAAAQAAPVDTVAGPRRPRFNVTALRGGQFVYQMTLERDAGTTVIGTRTVSVSLVTYAGSPSWLMSETRVSDFSADGDSLYTDLVSLRPLHWGAKNGGMRVSAEFRGDSIFGATTAPTGRRSLVTTVPRGTFINNAMLETVLRLVPLSSTWEDSASTLTGEYSNVATLPTRLSVIGEDRVRLPAGTFDCWVVAIHAGETARGLYWVTKQDPIVVRTALDVPSMSGAQLVSALQRIGR
jgi:hypothetical protein